MPIFFHQEIDKDTKLGIWKIEEGADFFLEKVMPQRQVHHPHKKLQHLAGRYILQYLFPDFPVELIQIADTRKPFLEDEAYHFSISHCADFAAAIVSRTHRVGLDIEIVTPKVEKILHKFLHADELEKTKAYTDNNRLINLTILWSAKEALFKWWGWGGVDFSEMLRLETLPHDKNGNLKGCVITNNEQFPLHIFYEQFPELVLAWTASERK
ncbi:MAG TPA: 4'-phosphopantetheinyl transferase superfamily protein [Flavisolibacter sp.]|nr:4'-phosphopantetheinyl transferase superfamily protein [Flavisolibacter sp.]